MWISLHKFQKYAKSSYIFRDAYLGIYHYKLKQGNDKHKNPYSVFFLGSLNNFVIVQNVNKRKIITKAKMSHRNEEFCHCIVQLDLNSFLIFKDT